MKYIICDINDSSRGWGGTEFNTKEAFLKEISEIIDDFIKDGREGFGVSIYSE